MPNGSHNDPAIDLIVHRHTEHGHHDLHAQPGSGGWISAHVEHDRGYAYAPLWETLDLARFVRRRRPRPTRAEMEELAAELVAGLVSLQASNPRSVVRPDRASALLLLQEWCVVLGGYHVYMRGRGKPLERVEPPIGSRCGEDMQRMIALAPELHYLARDSHVHAGVGLLHHAPDQCVYDLAAVDELLASTVPLHERPEWSEISRAPLDSVESVGRVLVAVRDEAVEHGSDHAVVRWRAGR